MLAYILNICGWLLLPFMDGIAKYLSTEIHFLQVVWGRYFFMLLISIPLAFIFFRKELKFPKSLSVQLWRSFFLFLSTVFFFFSISIISLAEALTLAFVSPIIVTVLSIFYLKEKVGIHRWLAVFVGFFGVIIILRPTTNIISEGSIFALIGAVIFAVYLILTRYVSREDSAITSFFWTGIGGTVTMSIISLFIWNNIPEEDYLWLFLMCLLSASSHFMMVKTLQVAEASVIQPFSYLQLVFGSIIGVTIFSESINSMIVIGVIVVISSGLFTTWHEYKKKYNI